MLQLIARLRICLFHLLQKQVTHPLVVRRSNLGPEVGIHLRPNLILMLQILQVLGGMGMKIVSFLAAQ
ncbi:hypothetical protein D3C76_883230 [compost metagenome]